MNEFLMNEQEFKLLYSSLAECSPNPEHFDFGPAYGMAVARRAEAQQILKRIYQRAQVVAQQTKGMKK